MADNSAKINLVLGFHEHIPYGAPDQEFEECYEKKLKPCISNLYKYPHVQAALHYSGPLLHYVERSHPELLMLIEDMVSRRQVEMLGGGFYEPMFPLLPLQDKIGQIELFTTYLRKQFGKRPAGFWMPQLAWEQNLIGPLASCGMGYTFLGEDQFLRAGLRQEDVYSPALTEDQGKMLAVFPVFHSIEKALAQKNVQAVFKNFVNKMPLKNEITVSVFPSCVFSGAEESSDYSWNRFFDEISLLEGIVECASPSKILKGTRGFNKACFSGTYDPASLSPRRFLIAFPEANGIYSKMIFTNMLINHLRGDKARKKNAREELWKAQGAGLFSRPEDLYQSALRKAAYRSLLGAERISREKGKFVPSLVGYDFDFDGREEFLFQDQKINCYIQSAGAGVFELDYLPEAWNYLDTCLAAPPSPVRRAAFADSLLPPKTGCGDLLKGPIPGGRYCSGEHYAAKELEKIKGKACFTLAGKEALPFGNIGIEKVFSLKKDTLAVNYALCNYGEAEESFCFATEIDLSFPGEGDDFVRIYKCKAGAKDLQVKALEALNADALKIQDIKNEVLINISSTNIFDMCVKPHRIRQGDAELYQSTVFIPIFSVTLKNGETWKNEFTLKFTN